MRKVLFGLAVALFVFASCDTNPIEDSPVISGKKVPVTIKAEQIDEGVTKSIRNDDKSVSWMPNDEITVVCGTEKAKFTSTNTENALIASFTGELSQTIVNAINNGTNTNPVWGLYPYDENVESDGTYITTTLPSQQTGVAGTFADDLFITLAKSNNFSLYFYNVCSGFKFSVTKEGVNSITIRGNNNEDIAGKIRLTFVDGKPKAEVVEGEKTITLVPKGKTFEVGKDYYIVMLPTDFTQGFTVTFNTLSQTGNFAYSNSISFPRSKFVTRNSVDSEVEFAPSSNNIVFADYRIKEKLVAAFDTDGDGEISYLEAAIVTSFNNVFGNETNYTSFNEFQFFTGITSIPLRTFRYWKLTSIVLPPSIKTIGSEAFLCCDKLREIIIPANVNTIGGAAFLGCTALIRIICLPDNPPSLLVSFNELPFNGTNDCPICVSGSKLEIYKLCWSVYSSRITMIE